MAGVFVGVHERQLDDKGRLALPPAFRSLVGASCYLVVGLTGCVEIYAPSAFEARAAKMLADVEARTVSLNRQRAFAGSATLVTLDKQGRIMVDERLRQFADLQPGARVVVAGNIDRGEIWNEQRRAAIESDGWAEMAGPDTAGPDAAVGRPTIVAAPGPIDAEGGREDESTPNR